MGNRTALAASLLGLLGALSLGACSIIAGLDGLDFADGGAACSASKACPSQGPCVRTSCNAASGVCESTPIADDTAAPGATQTAGDCHHRVCLLGAEVDVVDDTDKPVTTTPCEDAVCTQGTPSNPPSAAGTKCKLPSGVGVCDTLGACVACAADADCAGTSPNDTCQHPTCQADHTCAPVLAATGASCGAGMFCDAAGVCGGCTVDGQCTPPATCGGGAPGAPGVCGCTPTTCAALGKTCGAAPDGCGVMLACDDGLQNGGESDVDCGGPSCATRCALAKKCAAGTDCLSGSCADGVCCSLPCTGACHACTAAKKGGGSDGVCGIVASMTDPDKTCSPYVCGAGVCLASCGASDAACAAGDYCDGVGAGACLAKKASGGSCVGNHECLSGTCLGSGCL